MEKILTERGEKDIELRGVFDSKFGKPDIDIKNFSTMGFVDVLKNISYLIRIFQILREIAVGCDKVLLMDSSSFNIRLAKSIRKINKEVEIIYYILPQVWAWKESRVKLLEKYCDKLYPIYPFELEYYSDKARYLGNPILDYIDFEKKESNNSEIKKILLMPGSRKIEIEKMTPIFNEFQKIHPNFNYILLIPEKYKDSDITAIYGDLSNFEISYDFEDATRSVDFAFVCSGTATLEIALKGIPFVLVYKANKIDAFIARLFVKLKYIGLPNIIAEKAGLNRIHPELIQEECSVDNLVVEFKKYDFINFYKNRNILKKYLKEGSAKNISNILFS